MKSPSSIMGLVAALAGGIVIFLVQLQGGGNPTGVLTEPRTTAPASPLARFLSEPPDTPADTTQPPSATNNEDREDTNNEGINWAQLIVTTTLGAILSGVVGALTPIAINRFVPRLEKA